MALEDVNLHRAYQSGLKAPGSKDQPQFLVPMGQLIRDLMRRASKVR